MKKKILKKKKTRNVPGKKNIWGRTLFPIPGLSLKKLAGTNKRTNTRTGESGGKKNQSKCYFSPSSAVSSRLIRDHCMTVKKKNEKKYIIVNINKIRYKPPRSPTHRANPHDNNRWWETTCRKNAFRIFFFFLRNINNSVFGSRIIFP